ncbi:UDP-N-acetylmuramate dehydrogenase [Candidatus Enterovibrio escicola]|uniref:UDP-N-acetylenolpyruvoylglucosamine reductase n=1 Tax=Candidatus Enterovibrio escicola TaxID=1927127 RepID=A0A2A5T6Y4_9GAMM|nr:UDP-N-acetylmuramate dehydrogenase [Candidatus Enterovibrio escacola]PCS23933.1 UDP-N-acetylenolpyruvoylglucosamine reductase [Candidatus Enterovibrio escacola]
MKIHMDTSLKRIHTFGLDVLAKTIVEAECPEDFLMLWREAPYVCQPKLIVGEGSNLLFCGNFEGIVVLNRLKGISITESTTHWHLHVAGGESWHELVMWTVKHGMLGLENLALIPGLVGSAPIQNIGAYGVEFDKRCEYVDVLSLSSGGKVRLLAAECGFGYRDSVFKGKLKYDTVILAVGLMLAKAWSPVIEYSALVELAEREKITAQTVFDKVCKIRREKLPDPSVTGNAGSFFKNPVILKSMAEQIQLEYPMMPFYHVGDNLVKLLAGWLIDQAGLKGHCIGGAAVHEKQAPVLINSGKATPTDVINLAEYVLDTVYQQFAVKLEHEVRFIGREHEISLETICQS